MSIKYWWECDHEAKGISGCPICDSSLDQKTRQHLLIARAKILALEAEINSAKKPQLFDNYFNLI